MRGASALDRLLAELPRAELCAFVVWEPVLPTDVAPPLSSVLGQLRDTRASQYWDRQRALSRDIVRAVNADPARYGFERPLPEEFVVWDVVAVFGRSPWEADLPVPAYYGGPVVHEIDATRAALVRVAEGEASASPEP